MTTDTTGGGEIWGGIALLVATALALIVANSPLAGGYHAALDTPLAVGPLSLPILYWINDGLMAVFFLSVGLELKAEFLEGRLKDRAAVILPAAAALGGMICPALIYLALTAGAGATRGWAVPMATDIAFAVGVLALVGRGAPPALRNFLLTLAVLDDLGAILVIALFYGHGFHVEWALAALVPLTGLLVLMRLRVASLWPALVLAAMLWVCVFQSGIHATVAGVLAAAFIPLRDRKGGSPLHRLAGRLGHVIGFGILPLFALANAGLPLGDVTLTGADGQIALGVGVGLLLGKLLGVVLAVWLVVRLWGLALPVGLGWGHIAVLGCLAGIGFTMCLFIAGLAFGDSPEMNAVRVGVLAASALAALLGGVGLRRLRMRSGQPRPPAV